MHCFKGNNITARHAFEVIYADIWGPVDTSMQGHRYALLLVDEYTSYTWVFFLAQKSQAEDAIKSFIMHQFNLGKPVGTLRSDNGGEFSSGSLKYFLWERGIKHAQSPCIYSTISGKSGENEQDSG